AAGVVAEVGDRVTKFKPGDRVTALPFAGAYAEYLSMPAGERVAKVQEGESVLVHAAAGGVGMLCVQVLKRDFKNVKVIGLTSSDEKCKVVLEAGADHAINYKANDYVAEVEKIMGAKPRGFAPGAPLAGVDVVLNGVAGGTLQKDRLLIKRLGRWVLFGTPAGTEPIN